MIPKIEMAGLSLFTFLYIIGLLSGIYQGEKFSGYAFFAFVFIISLIVLFIMVDKMDVVAAKIDEKVALSTFIASLVFAFFGVTSASVRMYLLSTISFPYSVEYILYILLFNSLSETMFKFTFLNGLILSGLDWRFSLILTSGAFSFLHIFRYGPNIPALMYIFIMGMILMLLARLPKMFGSEIEFSIYPPLFAHMVHNLSISGAMFYLW